LDAVLRKHNQQPVVNLDGLIKLFVKFLAAFEISGANQTRMLASLMRE
jgi:hypothetical protein